VIPCLNVADTLPLQLEALARQSSRFPWEVIVADNGSTDSSVEVAERWREKLPAMKIVSETRRGRHHACNAGAQAASGECLIFVDGDDVAMPDFLEEMSRALGTHAMVAGRLEHRSLRADSRGEAGEVQADGLMEGYGFLPFVMGAAMGIRKSVFQDMGGFAIDKAYCEDTDLSWRVQLGGHKLGFAPGAVVAYRQRASPRAMWLQHVRFGESRALLYRDFAARGMPRRSGRDVVASWMSSLWAIPYLRDSGVKERWLRKLARNIGFLRGSIKYRVFYL
jgi:GT2 family glycosyltransferase